MRRMYTKKELSVIVAQVVDQKIVDGAFDEVIDAAVDDYLTEHPVDITVLEGKTIAPAVVNATTSVSAPSLIGATEFEKIKDADGHLRFVEENLDTATISGVTFTYSKWSLSGSHLMFVLAGTVENGTTIANATQMATSGMPAWIFNKIYPVFATEGIELKEFYLYDNSYGTQIGKAVLRKQTNFMEIVLADNITLTANRGFRIQFDLLIDNA